MNYLEPNAPTRCYELAERVSSPKIFFIFLVFSNQDIGICSASSEVEVSEGLRWAIQEFTVITSCQALKGKMLKKSE